MAARALRNLSTGKDGFNLNVKSRFSISSRLKLRVKQTMLNK